MITAIVLTSLTLIRLVIPLLVLLMLGTFLNNRQSALN
jgi:hypothetical protein